MSPTTPRAAQLQRPSAARAARHATAPRMRALAPMVMPTALAPLQLSKPKPVAKARALPSEPIPRRDIYISCCANSGARMHSVRTW